MPREMSGLVALTFSFDNGTEPFPTQATPILPTQADGGEVPDQTAIQEGSIRAMSCDIEAQQSDGDDMIFTVYVNDVAVPATALTIAGAGSFGGDVHNDSRFDKDVCQFDEGDKLAVKALSTDAVNTCPKGILVTLYVQVGQSEI